MCTAQLPDFFSHSNNGCVEEDESKFMYGYISGINRGVIFAKKCTRANESRSQVEEI